MKAFQLLAVLQILFRPTRHFVQAFSSSCLFPNISAEKFKSVHYDYVIIGGGTAGMALATRLSENPLVRVGVIEAGVYHINDPLVDEPGISGEAIGNTEYDWVFANVPQPGANYRNISQPRGKMLGGSSGLNLLAWTRASETEYNAWEYFAPGTGWNWKGLLPFMKKTENIDHNLTNTFPGISVDTAKAVSSCASKFEGFTGAINGSYNVIYSDIVSPWVSSLNNYGIPTNANPDSGSTVGIQNSRLALNRALGVRSYSATSYYCQGAWRPNLAVLTNALATKILFDSSKTQAVATGVLFSSNSKSYSVIATREVILSAGAVQTPHLLELSGIGNSTILNNIGIETMIDLPGVGENMQEQLYAPVQFVLNPGHITFGNDFWANILNQLSNNDLSDMLRNNATFDKIQQEEYNVNGTGWLAAVNSAIAYIPYQSFLRASDQAFMLQSFDESIAVMGVLSPMQKMSYAIYRSYLTNNEVPQVEIIQFSNGLLDLENGESYMSILAGLQHPLARGTIHIVTTDPTIPPAIDGNYLGNSYDVQQVLQALKLSIGAARASPVSNDIAFQQYPPANSTDEELIDWIRESIGVGSHILGTAAMAPREIGGVVNASLIVYGTSNLRIVDCSIIPLSIASHTQQTVYAIAEKAVAMILDNVSP